MSVNSASYPTVTDLSAADIAALHSRLVALARELGAVALRCTTAEPDAPTEARLRASIERGDLATWRFDADYARRACDPREILAGARAVLSVALPYRHAAPPRRRGAGRVSNYVFGADYHGEMQALLGALAREIDAVAGADSCAIVCDTKPFAERAFAARAGIGWIGKHTNLIVPGAGSFVFLGEIVTRVALPPDEPLKTHCGSCRLCIDRCPTGALRGDYTIDATRCISDLTQRRDAIPRALRPLLGDWVWGCDLCQEACPPAVRGEQGSLPAFAPGVEPYPDLLELLALSNAAFRERYGKTAMGWRGAVVLRRNAAVALGNGGDRATVPALTRSLAADPSALVREHAAWALGRIGSPAAEAGLERCLVRETEQRVRAEIFAALADVRRVAAVTSVVEDHACVS